MSPDHSPIRSQHIQQHIQQHLQQHLRAFHVRALLINQTGYTPGRLSNRSLAQAACAHVHLDLFHSCGGMPQR